MTVIIVTYALVTLRSNRGDGHEVTVKSVYEKTSQQSKETFVGYTARCTCGGTTEIVNTDSALDVLQRARKL